MYIKQLQGNWWISPLMISLPEYCTILWDNIQKCEIAAGVK